MASKIIDLAEYGRLLASIKSKIRSAQIKAAISVNKALLSLYWDIGELIIKKQTEAKWGDFLIEKLAVDLHGDFPNMKGFSRRNLFYMKQWVLFCTGKSQLVQQPVALIKNIRQLVGQIPWGHNVLLLSKIKSLEEAEFYLKETITHNWSVLKKFYMPSKGRLLWSIWQNDCHSWNGVLAAGMM
jgi:predicted nuclease of restriction endonuclease-like (RecB) superfamily